MIVRAVGPGLRLVLVVPGGADERGEFLPVVRHGARGRVEQRQQVAQGSGPLAADGAGTGAEEGERQEPAGRRSTASRAIRPPIE